MDSSLLASANRPKSISKAIIDRIVTSIVSGDLAPGEKLPTEEIFAERVGVGRSSIREAMKILEAFGVVEIRRADGIYVAKTPNPQMVDPVVIMALAAMEGIEDVVDFVILLQRFIAEELAAPKAAQDLGDCQSMLRECKEDDDGKKQFVVCMRTIDTHLAPNIENPILRSICHQFAEIILSAVQNASEVNQQNLYREARACCAKGLASLACNDCGMFRTVQEQERRVLISLLK